MSSLITPETVKAHQARWFVYTGGCGQPLEKIPHAASTRGHWRGYDVEVLMRVGVQDMRRDQDLGRQRSLGHRFSAQVDAELRAEARAVGYDPDDQASYSWFPRLKLDEAQG